MGWLVWVALSASATEVELYGRQGCPRCADAKEYLTDLDERRGDVELQTFDLAHPEARSRLAALAAEHGLALSGVPVIHVGDTLLVGFDQTTPPQIERALAGGAPDTFSAGESCAEAPDAACDPAPDDAVVSDIVAGLDPRQLGLPTFTVALGLIDGFNPCATWVLLFLLSVLTGLRDRQRMVIVAGTFVVVSGLAYFAFMAAWLNLFRWIGLTRTVQVLLAGTAVVMAGIHIKDFFAFHRGITLSIPESAHPMIAKRTRNILKADTLLGALVGAFVLAVLVNFVELLCTAGIPALYTGVLVRHELSALVHHAYLALYCCAYMADDALMVSVAVFTLSRARVTESAGRWLKLLSGSVLGAIGLILLVRPDWLAW